MPYFLTTDGCRIFFEDRYLGASKPLVVQVNGTCQTTVHWTVIANLLKDDFQVLLYDGRAQGRSDLGEIPLSLEIHAGDLRDLLRHLGVGKANPVGISHGAGVALAFAAQNTDMVERAVACSITARRTNRAKLFVKSWIQVLEYCGVNAMIQAALPVFFGEKFLRENDAMLDKIMRALVRRNSKEGLTAHLQAVETYPPLARIAPNVNCPVLVLSGSDDPLTPPAGARELAELCRGRHEILEGAGHSIPAEAPKLFAKIIKDWVNSGD